MRILIRYILLVLLSSAFLTCEKYDQGGTLLSNRRHLFGEKKNGASKTWKLRLYEVNGIDSTHLIPGANQIPEFRDKFITFKLDNKEGYSFTATSWIFNYSGNLGFSPSKEIIIGTKNMPLTKVDSTQCGIINNTNVCLRNLIKPEFHGPPGSGSWTIIKLTKKEFIIANNQFINKYKIAFECH